jgi:hypothetical protein
MADCGEPINQTSEVVPYLDNAIKVMAMMKKHCPNMTVAQADLFLWTRYSGREKVLTNP